GPMRSQKVHAKSGQEEMRQAKETERPRKGEQKINQRAGIKRHRIPLGEKRQAASTQRIPNRQFPTPKAVPMILREGVSKTAVVSIEKCLPTEDDAGKKSCDQQSQQQCESWCSEP